MTELTTDSWNLTQRKNGTLTEPRAFAFLTVKDGYKTFFIIWSVTLIVVGISVNTLMLYITKQSNSVPEQQIESTNATRKHILYYFIFNLAISDAAGSFIAIPLLTLDLLFEITTKNSFVCRTVRFPTLLFPTVTLFLLLVITADRFLPLVTPLFILRRSTARKIVCSAWLWSTFIVCLGLPSFQVQRWDLDERQYTLVCVYSSGVKKELKLLYILFVCFAYLIPCVVIISLSISMANRIWKSPLPATPSTLVNEREKQKTTKVLLSAVGAFVIPYLAYIIYGLFRVTGLLPDASYQTDYTLRYFWAALAYTNVVVNPVVIFFQIKSLRIRLRAKVGFVNQVAPADTQFVQFLALDRGRESSMQTMRESEHIPVTIPDCETAL